MTKIDAATLVSYLEHSRAVDELWELFNSTSAQKNPELKRVLGETGAAHLAAAPDAFDKDKEAFYIEGFYPFADDEQKKMILARANTLTEEPKDAKDLPKWFRDINILLPIYDEEQQTVILQRAGKKLKDPNLKLPPLYGTFASGRLLQHTSANTKAREDIFGHFISMFEIVAKKHPKDAETYLYVLKDVHDNKFNFDITQTERDALDKVVIDAGKFNLTNLLSRVGLPNPFEAKHTSQ